jgi:hypothetical protein
LLSFCFVCQDSVLFCGGEQGVWCAVLYDETELAALHSAAKDQPQKLPTPQTAPKQMTGPLTPSGKKRRRLNPEEETKEADEREDSVADAEAADDTSAAPSLVSWRVEPLPVLPDRSAAPAPLRSHRFLLFSQQRQSVAALSCFPFCFLSSSIGPCACPHRWRLLQRHNHCVAREPSTTSLHC